MMQRIKKGTALLLALAMLLVLLTGCGAEPEVTEEPEENNEVAAIVSGQVLTGGNAADDVFSLCVDYSASLNPLTTKNALNQMVDCLVYDMLFEIDENFELTSRVLSDWYYVDSSGTGVWVLTVRPDIQMHDGTMLTAGDIIYSLSRVFSRGTTYLQTRTGTVYASGGGDTVYIAGLYSNAMQLYRLAVPIIKSDSVLEDTPVGSGPYMYSEEKDSLVKFDGYEFADQIPIDTIYLKQYSDSEDLISQYESGELDLVLNDPTGIYNLGYGGKNEKRVFPTTNLHYIGFNSKSDFFCYQPYRYALTYLIDRERIATDVLDGAADATAIPIHPNSPIFDAAMNESLSFSKERAITELEKLGCRDLDNDGQLEFALSGIKMEINIRFIVCADNTAKVLAARKIAEDMESVGLHVDLQELSWSEYKTKLNEGEFDMFYAETAMTADWDTLPIFEELEDEENVSNLNYGRWSLSTLEDTVRAYLAAKDDDQAPAITTMLQTMADNAVFWPVCYEKREVLTHLGVVKGMQPNQYNVFHNITNWTINMG